MARRSCAGKERFRNDFVAGKEQDRGRGSAREFPARAGANMERSPKRFCPSRFHGW